MRKTRGFTLIELMIVVAIIGILAAIAIPNFIRFQARSKQGEAKSNLKALFTAQRSFFQEKDRYSDQVRIIGFAPERGNRYYYQAGNCAQLENRSAQAITWHSDDTCVSVDKYKYATATLQPAFVAPSAEAFTGGGGGAIATGTPGVAGTCPACDFLARAAGNVDNETVGIDSWFVASRDGAITAACGNQTDTASPAGEPYNTNNDVNCD